MSQSDVRNILLQSMAADDYALLAIHLQLIELPVRFRLHAPGSRIASVYFPETGIISIVAVALNGDVCEVGLLGREGMSETATALGTDQSPHETFVQVVGTAALKLPVAILNEAFEKSPTLRRHLLRYAQAMMVQLSSSIAAASQTIPQRLSRRLLMCHDRVDGDEVDLKHELVARMLGVRRAGVSVGLKSLESVGLITVTRGKTRIVDRPGLERLAGGSYGLAETEYERLIGQSLRRTAS